MRGRIPMYVITYEGKYWAGMGKFTQDEKEARAYAMLNSAKSGRKRIIVFHKDLNPELLKVEER